MADKPIPPPATPGPVPSGTSPSAATPSAAALRRALRRVRDGVALDVTEAAVLLAARGEQLDELLTAAARVRDAGLVDAGRPGVVTYSRKVFIPLTRLCRDRCHYCTFATVPHRLPAAFLERDEVLEIARAGAAQGCKEALFTLGDRPEERWPAAREWLEARGYHSTLEYVRACADRGAGGDRAAAAPQPRRHELGGAHAAQAGRAVDGDDAGDHGHAAVERARRPALRQPRQGARRPAAHAHRRRAGSGCRSPPGSSSASGRTGWSGPSRSSRSGRRRGRTGTSRR